MKEVFYASSGWADLEDHAFESEDDCKNFAKERIISKLGKNIVAEHESDQPEWLSQQFEVYAMNFHREGQY